MGDDRVHIDDWGQRDVIAHWIEEHVESDEPYRLADDLMHAIAFQARVEWAPAGAPGDVIAERDRLQRVLADVFVALYPPGDGDSSAGTVEHTELPTHVYRSRTDRDRLRAVVMSQADYIGELIAERDRLRERLEAERRHRIRAVDEEVWLRAVVDALTPFVGHGEDCAVESDYPCDCGLDLIFAQLDASPTGEDT